MNDVNELADMIDLHQSMEVNKKRISHDAKSIAIPKHNYSSRQPIKRRFVYDHTNIAIKTWNKSIYLFRSLAEINSFSLEEDVAMSPPLITSTAGYMCAADDLHVY